MARFMTVGKKLTAGRTRGHRRNSLGWRGAVGDGGGGGGGGFCFFHFFQSRKGGPQYCQLC
jgi:hypothetical protein